MIFNLRLLPTVVGIAIGLGMAEPFLLGSQSVAIARSTKKPKVYRLPSPPKDGNNSRGFPGKREAAVNRACPSAGTRLVALAPRFGSVESGEESVWGQTTQVSPTLWFLVAGVDRSAPLEFFLQDRENNNIYEVKVAAPVKDGVMGVKVSRGQELLLLNQDYRWTLKATFFCGGSEPETRYVEGWIRRVGLGVEREGWYDAVTGLAERRLRERRNVGLGQDWREFLEAVDLGDLAGQPVLGVRVVE